MRSVLSVVCTLVLVAACGQVPGTTQARGDYKLYEAVSDRSQIAIIDSRSHAIERTLPLGTPSSDWKHLYSVSGSALVDTDPLTGSTVRSLKLAGTYRLPFATASGVPGGLSEDGGWLVVESFDETSGSIPTASHFAVANTAFNSPAIQIDLPGYFDFDAISNDGQYMYLIEYMSASNYNVRIYDVAALQLDPQIVVDKTDPKESMTGVRLSGVPSHDGSWLYSIYIRQNDNPFIHALNTQGNPIAFCIDLPGSGYQSSDNAFQWSLAMSSDGSHLYAANAATGAVSELNIGDASLDLARTVKVDSGVAVAGLFAQDVQAKEFGANGAVISPDGKTLVTLASSGIVWVDTGSLRARTHALTNWTVWSLALSPDGKLLYALSDSGKIAEVSMDSGKVNATFDPGTRNPMALMRVAA